MKNYEEIKEMFNLGDEEIYFSNKGEVSAEKVIITEDYTRSEAAGMLYGSEFVGYIVLRDGQEITEEEYKRFRFTYEDKTERYTESGEECGIRDKSYNYENEGVNLSECEVYILNRISINNVSWRNVKNCICPIFIFFV